MLPMKLKKIKRFVLRKMMEFRQNPLNWNSFFWESNLANEFPDRIMRLSRILLGLTYFLRMVSISLFGVFLFVDGAYSVFRNRFELKLTKSWVQDIPRVSRACFGLLLFLNPIVF